MPSHVHLKERDRGIFEYRRGEGRVMMKERDKGSQVDCR